MRELPLILFLAFFSVKISASGGEFPPQASDTSFLFINTDNSIEKPTKAFFNSLNFKKRSVKRQYNAISVDTQTKILSTYLIDLSLANYTRHDYNLQTGEVMNITCENQNIVVEKAKVRLKSVNNKLYVEFVYKSGSSLAASFSVMTDRQLERFYDHAENFERVCLE